jgi:hypothetical protein
VFLENIDDFGVYGRKATNSASVCLGNLILGMSVICSEVQKFKICLGMFQPKGDLEIEVYKSYYRTYASRFPNPLFKATVYTQVQPERFSSQ